MNYPTSLLLFAVLTAVGSIPFARAEQSVRVAQAAPAAAPASTMIDGEVRKVDKDAAKITLRHGPITNLDMPAMTMVFQVKDKAMLDQVKAGDKVRFAADKIGGAFTITELGQAE